MYSLKLNNYKKYHLKKKNNFRKTLLPEEEGCLPEEPSSGNISEHVLPERILEFFRNHIIFFRNKVLLEIFRKKCLPGWFRKKVFSGKSLRGRAFSPIHCLLGAPAILLGARSSSPIAHKEKLQQKAENIEKYKNPNQLVFDGW